MPRLIDAEHLKKRATNTTGDCWDNYGQGTADFLEYIDKEPTVEAIPIDWILNHEKMPKSGKGHDAIMDMIESWGERREDA